MPFDADAPPPVRVRARGRVVDAWGPAGGSRPPPPPDSPVRSDSPLEELVLVPFGATNLRVAVFPVLDGADALGDSASGGDAAARWS